MTTTYPEGANVYAQIDSVDYETNHGSVDETDEDNNLFGPVISTANTGEISELSINSESLLGDDLPHR